MVAAEFHDFFLGAAGVAGALIGLLFVAISVNPGEASAGPVVQRIRPAASLSAFLNPLFVSLVALLPARNPIGAFLFLGAAATLAVLGLLWFVVRENRGKAFRTYRRALLSLVVQLAACIVQIIAVFGLSNEPENPNWVLLIAFTVIVFFAMGIDRAWEFVGAQSTSLFGSLASQVLHGREPSGKGHVERTKDD